MKTSVALCSFNGEAYILQQLESIVNQTKEIDEIVICDDGSEDNTIPIIEEFSKNTKVRILLYKNVETLGYIRNFEKAITLCSGDIIFLADQDDIWVREKVEIICQYFKNHPAVSYVFTNASLINEFGVESYDRTLFDTIGMNDQNKKIFDKGFATQVLATGGRVTGATTAIRASFVPYCIPFRYMGRVHDEMLAVTAAVRNKLGYIDQCLIKYRLHTSQAVGLTALFLFPPQPWHSAINLLMWHENLIEESMQKERAQMRTLHKRYWAIRSCVGIIKICTMLLSGVYKTYYDRCYSVFFDDLKSVCKRRIYMISQLKKIRITCRDDSVIYTKF